MHPQLEEALWLGHGVLTLAENPHLRDRVRRAVTAGDLRRPLPGVYVDAAATDPATMARALMVADPDAVLVGRSAAAVHGWPRIEPGPVCVAASRLSRRPGFVFERRTIPDRLVVELDRVRVTTKAMTALDMVGSLGGNAIDDALRLGVPLPALQRALELTPQRPGNNERRRLLHDSRSNPWSEAERAAHRALRAASITGWSANHPVVLGARTAYLDVAFTAIKLAVEIDGREFHDSWASRVRDAARDRRLAAAGWLVIRFAAREVLDDPDAFAREVAEVAAARLAACA